MNLLNMPAATDPEKYKINSTTNMKPTVRKCSMEVFPMSFNKPGKKRTPST
jgi:hypothetical protein